MSASKPIDWTRPLRTIYDRRPARVVSIDPTDSLPVLIEIARLPGSTDDLSLSLRVDRDGCGRPSKLFDVENVPDPRIVERFMIAHAILSEDGSRYEPARGFEFFTARDDAEATRATIKGPNYYVARVLIEEPGT